MTELLLEQVECADTILINKCDLLADQTQVELVKAIIRRINPSAVVKTCVRGELEAAVDVLGSAGAEGAASWGILDEHRQMVEAVKKQAAAECDEPACTDPSHDHSHGEHSHAAETSATKACDEPACTDPTHNHSHDDHNHSHASEASDCNEPACTDPTHNHSHDHDHGHSHASGADISHSHHPSETDTTAKERFGITSFVYVCHKYVMKNMCLWLSVIVTGVM